MNTTRGRLAAVLKPVLACALGLAGILLGTPGAHAATAPFPNTLSIQGAYGTAQAAVPVPAGTAPVRLRGSIVSTFSTPGDLVVDVAGRTAARVPAVGGGTFSVDLSPADVVDGTVPVGLHADLDPQPDCFADDRAVATLTDPVLRLDTAPAPPTTIAGFLSPGASSYVVVVPPAPSPEEQQAGLDAVLALGHTVPGSTAISLVLSDQPPPTTPTRRTVVVTQDTTSGNALAVRDGRLHVTGPADSLSAAAISLADPNTGLLQVASAQNVTSSADFDPPEGTTSLIDIGLEDQSIRGIGRVSRTVTVPQAAFGAPVSQLIFDVKGATTPVLPGQYGRFNIRWNDELVASQVLTQDWRVRLPFTITAPDLRSANYLSLELEFLPAGGDCSDPPLAGQVDINAAVSTVSPTFGTSAGPGFQRFPQSLRPVIPVAAAGPLKQTLPDLADVLSAAVAASPWQYTVHLTEVQDLAAEGGVAAGVSPAQADALGAPLPAEQARRAFPAGDTTPYAALQAFQSGDADIITLSGEPVAAAGRLARWPQDQQAGWSSLTGQVYVLATAGEQPEAFAAQSTAPDKRTPQIIAAAVTTTILLVVLMIWLRRRPQRR